MNSEITLAKCPICGKFYPADKIHKCRKMRTLNCWRETMSELIKIVLIALACPMCLPLVMDEDTEREDAHDR